MLSLLLLLSYHRRLRMTHKSARAACGGGRVSHSWCMCVVGHGCGGLDGGRDRGDSWQACGTKGRVSGVAGALLECEVNTLITSDRTTIQVRSSTTTSTATLGYVGQVGARSLNWREAISTNVQRLLQHYITYFWNTCDYKCHLSYSSNEKKKRMYMPKRKKKEKSFSQYIEKILQ